MLKSGLLRERNKEIERWLSLRPDLSDFDTKNQNDEVRAVARQGGRRRFYPLHKSSTHRMWPLFKQLFTVKLNEELQLSRFDKKHQISGTHPFNLTSIKLPPAHTFQINFLQEHEEEVY